MIVSIFLKNPENPNINKINALLSQGFDVNKTNKKKLTLLLAAVQKKNLAVALLALQNGADPNLADKEGYTPLMHAIELDHIPLVSLLMQYHANSYYRSKVGLYGYINAIFLAKIKNNFCILKELYNPNLSIDKKTGDSRLHKAVRQGDFCEVKVLMMAGLDPFLKNKALETPLSIAEHPNYLQLQQKIFNQKIWKSNKISIISNKRLTQYVNESYELNEFGVCVGIAGMGVFAILLDDIKTFNQRLLAINQLEIINTLRNNSQPTFTCDQRAFFDGVALFQHPQYFYELFPNQIRIQDLNSVFPLITPCLLEAKGGVVQIGEFFGVYTFSELKILLSLIRQYIDWSYVKRKDPIAFVMSIHAHTIAFGYHPQKKQWMFIDAESLSAANIKTNCAMAKAIYVGMSIENPKEMIIPQMSVYVTKSTHEWYVPILMACKNNKIWKKIHAVSEKKALYVGKNDSSWLIIACHTVNPDIRLIKKLLEKGANPNQEVHDHYSVMSFLAEYGNAGLFELLFKWGATLYDSHKAEVLYTAVKNNDVEVVKWLLTHHVNPNLIYNEAGQSPLHKAVECGFKPMVEILLKGGGDPLLKNNEGETAVDIANMHRFFGIKKQLDQKVMENTYSSSKLITNGL